MKKLFFLPLVALLLWLPTVANAGIPVVDGSNLSERLIEWMQTVQQYGKTVEHYAKQLQAYDREYNAISGYRSIGDVANDPMLHQYLQKNNLQSVNDLILEGKDLSGLASQYQKGLTKYDRCAYITDSVSKSVCYSHIKSVSSAMSDLQTLMTKTNDRVSNIEKLRQEINQTKDLKAASDLTSRMEAESADIQNQQQQMQIVFQQTQLQQLVIDEQEREDNARYFAPKTGLKLQPIQW